MGYDTKWGILKEAHAKAIIWGVLMAAFGGAVGGYISAKTGNHTYSGAGAVIGWLVGILFAVVLRNKVSLQRLINIQTIVLIVFVILSLLMATVGIIVFLYKGQGFGLVGAIFFFMCCLVFIWKIKQTRTDRTG